VTFEKETAAKTALLLDNTQLGSTQVSVSSATGGDDFGHHTNEERDSDELTQEEKPRSRIIAEYLAHGYRIGDQAIQKSIELDNKHGVSDRFLKTLQNLDAKYHATDKAKAADSQYQVTQKATTAYNSLLTGLSSYYEKASGTPTGQKLVNFYTQAQVQALDVHNEAKRLAGLKGNDAAGNPSAVPGTEKTVCKCGSSSSACNCEEGKCGCNDCGKSDVKTVPGSDKTTCGCGGETSACACEAGHCACSSCPKAETKKVEGSEKTTCQCGGNSGSCPCAEGKCACKGCSK
jgi:hypothetical protein